MSILNVVLAAAMLACAHGLYARPSNSSAVHASKRYLYIPFGPVVQPTPVAPPTNPVQPNPVQPNPVNPVQPRAACPSTNSDNFHKTCLYQINSIRLTHNVPEVIYDDTLAAEAKKCAENFARAGNLKTPICSYQNAGVTVGQNGATPSQACRAAISDFDYGWYSEIPKGPLTWPAPTYAPGNENIVQVLWKNTSHVGCGLSDLMNNIAPATFPEHVLVCLWTPAGGTPSLYGSNVFEDTC